MSQKTKRKSIPVNLEKAQEKASQGEIRPKMQLNVPEEIASSIKTKQQKLEEQVEAVVYEQEASQKEAFKTKCYYYGAVLAGVGICYLTWRYFFKSNPPADVLVRDIINGSV